jgi:hypothetical protein
MSKSIGPLNKFNMSNLQDEINELKIKIKVVEMLLEYIYFQKKFGDRNVLPMPVEEDKFLYYQALARKGNVEKLQDELKQLRDLLLQERQLGMSNTETKAFKVIYSFYLFILCIYNLYICFLQF